MIAEVHGPGSVGAVAPAKPAAPQTAVSDSSSPSADSVSVASASGLRAMLAGPDAGTRQLQRVASFVDVADGALERTQDLVSQGRVRVLAGGGSLDDILGSIDQESADARFSAGAGLRDGVTIAAGAATLDVPPVSTDHLGAVVEAGRSHRLTDLRAGGTLDSAAYRSGAIRSLDAAASEIVGLRARLEDFRTWTLIPAQRGVLQEIEGILKSPPLSAREAEAMAQAMRGAISSAEALLGTKAANVLALLT